MQKKIIALAVAAALATPAMALAEATVYGIMDGSIDMVTTGDGVPDSAATKGHTVRRISSNQSRLGFKGSEDVGGGLSAIWQIESSVNFMGGTIGSTRNTFVGLKSKDMGTLIIGQHDTPYKSSTRKLDVFGDHVGDNRSMLGKSGAASFDARNDDTILYMSPNMGGISVNAAIVNNKSSNALDTQARASDMSLAGIYSDGPIYAAVAYETHKSGAAEEKGTRFGVGYTMDALQVNFIYETISDNLSAATTNGHDAMSLGASYKVSSSGKAKISYTSISEKDRTPAPVNADATQIALGYDHSLSKSTTLYAIYAMIDNADNSTYALFNHAAAAGSTGANPNGGADPSVISVGMQIKF